MRRAPRAAPRQPLLPAALAVAAVALLLGRFAQLAATAPDVSAAAAAVPVAALWLSVLAPGSLLARAAGFLGGPRQSGRSDPVLAAAAVFACGTGAAMALQWVLYALSLRSVPVQRCLSAATALAGLAGAVLLWARRGGNRAGVPAAADPASAATRLSGAWTLALAVALGAAAGCALAGLPYGHWDAVLSWDKWATDAAARTGLGRHVCGGYPQGVPLLLSSAFQIAGASAQDPLSSPHLLSAAALHAVFALGAFVSVAAVARRFGAGAPVALAALVFLPDVRARFFDPEHFGLADLPAAASTLGALAVASAPEPAAAGDGRLPVTLARRAAVAAAFFGMVFSKGNGLAHLPFVVAAAVFARGRASFRPVLLPALAALALALPFWAHQWWFGVHLDMPGADPLLHSMEVLAAHTRLFSPGFDHLSRWLGLASSALLPFRSPGAAGNAALAAAAFAVCAAAFARRRSAPLAILAAGLGAGWFFTASYDARNALAAEFFLALCVGAAVCGVSEAIRRTRLPDAFGRALPGAVAALLLVAAARGGRAGEGGAPLAPAAFWLASRPAREESVSDVRFFHDFWRRAPWAARAGRLIAFSRDIRLWRGKGVYAMQRPALRGVRPGDLYFSFRSGGREVRPPAPFVPVAAIANHRLGRTLFEASPALSDTPFAATRADTGETVLPEEVLPAGSVVRVAVETPLRDGVAEVVFDRDLPGAVLSLAPESVRRDPYAKLFQSVSDGDAARAVWWTRKAAQPPVFEVTFPRAAALCAFRLGR